MSVHIGHGSPFPSNSCRYRRPVRPPGGGPAQSRPPATRTPKPLPWQSLPYSSVPSSHPSQSRPHPGPPLRFPVLGAAETAPARGLRWRSSRLSQANQEVSEQLSNPLAGKA
eukprot:1194718-Prorocentrum_minimum.AAC.17